MNSILSDFKQWNLLPVIGLELEFYITGDHITDTSLSSITKLSDEVVSYKKEEVNNQYELSIVPTADIKNLILRFEQEKNEIKKFSHQLGGEVLFDGKPFLDKSGSGMHIHINLLKDNDMQNVFIRDKDKQESKQLLFAIGGLCKDMKESMPYFIGNDQSYNRYKYPDFHTPTNVSWGGNNRTVALRIPEVTFFEECRRIEHRVPCADANLEDVLEVILKSIYNGIENTISPPPKIYGNAKDSQYKLESII